MPNASDYGYSIQGQLPGASAPKPWGVWCMVWGGVTGTRQAWLRHDDETMRFATEEEARDKAAECQDARKEWNTTGAQFSYEARRF